MRRKYAPSRLLKLAVFVLLCVSLYGFATISLPGQRTQPQLHLFVSFWAPSAHIVPHRDEVAAAIAANLANSHLSAVHVLLEASDDFTCRESALVLVELLERSGQKQQASLKCKEFYGEKLTYYDIFKESKQNSGKNTITIVANGDMVFDASVRRVLGLKKHVLGVVSTRGLHPQMTPSHIRTQYDRLVGKPITDIYNRCEAPWGNRLSWDAFIFRAGSLSLDFDAFTDELYSRPFVMNQNGAENSALNALLSSSRFSRATNLCNFVHMWHFHTQPRTHVNSSEEFVHHMYSWPQDCSTLLDCLGS